MMPASALPPPRTMALVPAAAIEASCLAFEIMLSPLARREPMAPIIPYKAK